MRLAALFWALLSAAAVAAPRAETRLGAYTAWYEAATHRYGHGIMGNLPEWGRLCLAGPATQACVTLPEAAVFEDMAPRLADLDHDGTPEVVVVESSVTQGAALVVYRLSQGTLVRIATPPIGARNRWLAPAAIADLDGDGRVEIAYVDRPHLAKVLRIWRYENGALHHVTDQQGLTNHRIGDETIAGGLRTCGGMSEILTANADWSQIIATRLVNGRTQTRSLDRYSATALRRALTCR
tara:strand:+ start:2297 stop:3013 length:717 start_codon:yes stop_codon:yes gene_type:complete